MRSKFYYLVRRAAVALLAVFCINEASAQYCTPTFTYGCSIAHIGGFSTSNGITDISNLNTGCSSTYTYYSTKVHTTDLNSTVNYTIKNNPSYNAEYKMWVDYNIDGDFDDAGEQVYTNSSVAANATVNGSFTVPATATPGTTRLRVRCSYYTGIGPCNTEYYGETEDYMFVIQSAPCTSPSSPVATNITSKTATLSWTGISGAQGYQYVLNTTAGAPATTPTNITGTTFNTTGLTPSTTYWLHVRTQCGPNSISMWVHYPFKTLPPCKPPIGFKTTNLTPISTTINWDYWPSAITYDYVIDQIPTDPGSATSITNTALNNANIPGLTEDTKYYVHIRSNCANNELSDWSLDSFTTPIPCRAPVINIDHINTTQAVAYWAAVPTATEYEYVLTKSATPPAVGTKYNYTSLHTSPLKDGEDYYAHVRCKCNSVNIVSTSPWGTANFKTFPMSVNNINNKEIGIKVYPNPVKDKLVLEINGNRDGEAAIVITDLAGRIVREMEVEKDRAEINVAGLPAGLYMLKYKDRSNTEVLRIIKQ